MYLTILLPWRSQQKSTCECDATTIIAPPSLICSKKVNKDFTQGIEFLLYGQWQTSWNSYRSTRPGPSVDLTMPLDKRRICSHWQRPKASSQCRPAQRRSAEPFFLHRQRVPTVASSACPCACYCFARSTIGMGSRGFGRSSRM